MNLEVDEKKVTLRKPVVISLFDAAGDTAVMANDATILWIMRDGTVMFNTCASEDLAAMGFQIEDERVVDRHPVGRWAKK